MLKAIALSLALTLASTIKLNHQADCKSIFIKPLMPKISTLFKKLQILSSDHKFPTLMEPHWHQERPMETDTLSNTSTKTPH